MEAIHWLLVCLEGETGCFYRKVLWDDGQVTFLRGYGPLGPTILQKLFVIFDRLGPTIPTWSSQPLGQIIVK